jgi:hypothetical protein
VRSLQNRAVAVVAVVKLGFLSFYRSCGAGEDYGMLLPVFRSKIRRAAVR